MPMTRIQYRQYVADMLRTTASDRPDHLAYINELIAWWEKDPSRTDSEPECDKLSYDVMVAIQWDASLAYSYTPGSGQPTPNRYSELRRRHRQAAAKRRETIDRQTPRSLQRLLDPLFPPQQR